MSQNFFACFSNWIYQYYLLELFQVLTPMGFDLLFLFKVKFDYIPKNTNQIKLPNSSYRSLFLTRRWVSAARKSFPHINPNSVFWILKEQADKTFLSWKKTTTYNTDYNTMPCTKYRIAAIIFHCYIFVPLKTNSSHNWFVINEG